MPACYVCVMTAGEAKMEHWEEGQSGLTLAKAQPAAGTDTAVYQESNFLMGCMMFSPCRDTQRCRRVAKCRCHAELC